MIANLLVLSCLLGATEVTVRPLQGEPVAGQITAISEKSVTIQTPSGPQVFPAASLQQVKATANVDPDSGTQNGAWVELLDESQFVAKSFELAEGKASVSKDQGRMVVLPSRMVESVRFFKPEEVTKKQWDEIKNGERAGDVLVVRKTAANNAATASMPVVLDQLEGIVHEIKGSSVAFEYDGERIDVPRAKLEGILFRSSAAAPMPDPACRVIDGTGAVWNVKTVQLQEGQVQLVSVAGAEVRFPLEDLNEVDYSAANLIFLSDLEPEASQWRPYLQSAATPASLIKWFQPKRDQGIAGQPLALNDVSYEKGLALHSRTQLTYRLTKNFTRLVATAGIEGKFRSTGNLVLEVFGDDRQLLSHPIKGADEPYELDLDIQGVRRLRIVVDFGDDRSDAGDLLYLCNARLMK